MRIQKLPSDVMITGLETSLYRAKTYNEWLVTVYYKELARLKDKQEPKPVGLRFSNMPMLAKGRIYNTTEPTKPYYKEASFVIDSLSNLSTSDKYNFEVIMDINYEKHFYKQIAVKIPKLELARILFFHNAYLASSSLQERTLDLDFSVKKVDDKNIITVLPHCSLVKTLFDDLGFRSKLSWLLLNPNIKNSYYSIYQNLVEHKTQDDKYERWVFNFTPPPLMNAKFQVKGYLNKNGILYVDEILGVSGISSGIQGEVVFEGDIFTEEAVIQSGAETSTQANTIKEPNISDEHQANSDMSTQLIETPVTIFEFLTPIVSSIKRSRTVKKPSIQINEDDDKNELSEIELLTVATDEATITGTVPKGEFQNTEDITPRDIQYRQSFIALIASLEKLNLENLTFCYHELPRVPRCKLYRKTDGNFRTLLEAKFQYNNQSFSLLEVDTTDLEKKRLSTLIVKDTYKVEDFNELLKDVVRTSITWSKIPFTQKVNINHPKDFYSGVADLEIMIESWSERILNSLNSLINE